ncbi:MAG: tRNA pseudouridine(38-40) synthase TruA [Candidatus Izemoplasma sp.]
MNVNKTINDFFESWKNMDYKKLDNILLSNFNFRDRLLVSHFGYKDSFEYINSRVLKSYNIINIVDGKNMIFVDIKVLFNNNGQLDNELFHYKFTLINAKLKNIFEEIIDDSLKRIKCIVSYDGSDFFGYQKQVDVRSIQEEIETAIFNISGETLKIHSSGRTDSKVHALNQVFHFDTNSKIDSAKWENVLNSYLPKSILIKKSYIVPQSFHSRYDTVSKEYMYIINTNEYNPINRNYEWFKSGIDVGIFEIELNKIVGVHDFRTFAKVAKNVDTIREIYSVKLEVTKNQIFIYIKGSGFLRYMVRNIVGALVDISSGVTSMDMNKLIKKENRNFAKNTAFAGGLYLYRVEYLK